MAITKYNARAMAALAADKRHQFTREDRQRGGWSRARQRAEERRQKPTQMEQRAQRVARSLGWTITVEHEIFTGAYPQWVDIWVSEPHIFGIEVDGSHSWHGLDFETSKMYRYDLAKMRWFRDQRIPLLAIHKCTRSICNDAFREWIGMVRNNQLGENFVWEFTESNGQLKWVPVQIPEEMNGTDCLTREGTEAAQETQTQ